MDIVKLHDLPEQHSCKQIGGYYIFGPPCKGICDGREMICQCGEDDCGPKQELQKNVDRRSTPAPQSRIENTF